MRKQKSKFYSLTPERLDENKKIYTEALDFAFSNSDIKNIAITGIYGAGKSTVWRTYEKVNRIFNVKTEINENHKNRLKKKVLDLLFYIINNKLHINTF